MKVYRIDFEESNSQVVTAEDREDINETYGQNNVDHIESYGPYISDCVYKELREEILH
jgi:hypothetical protein